MENGSDKKCKGKCKRLQLPLMAALATAATAATSSPLLPPPPPSSSFYIEVESFCFHGCHRVYSVAQAGLEPAEIHLPLSPHVLGLKE